MKDFMRQVATWLKQFDSRGQLLHAVGLLLLRLLALGAALVVFWVSLAFILYLLVGTAGIVVVHVNRYRALLPIDLDKHTVDMMIARDVMMPFVFITQAVASPILIIVLSSRRFRARSGVCGLLLVWSIISIAISIMLFGDLCERYGVRDMAHYGTPSYGTGECLYFSVVTWSTLGYGDFIPEPPLRAFAAAEALIGYLVMGLLVTALISWGNMARSREIRLNADESWAKDEVATYMRWVLNGNGLQRPSIALVIVATVLTLYGLFFIILGIASLEYLVELLPHRTS